MKKYIFAAYALIMSSVVFAQTEFDALRIGQTDIVGSARYMSMGGAFGALGGDASALKDNPAGLGVYRTGEVTATLNGMFQKANSTWYAQDESRSSGLGVKFNNVNYVMSIPLWEERSTGLLQSNFSFGYNRIKNFNRTMRAGGITPVSFTDFAARFTELNRGTPTIPFYINESDLSYQDGANDPYDDRNNMPWLSVLAYQGYLIKQDASGEPWKTGMKGIGESAEAVGLVSEVGGIGEYSFGWGGNFNNNLFVGANLNFTDISYLLNYSILENLPGGNFIWENALNQSGLGINLKLGAIYLPTNNLRIGVAFHTPTYFTISETGYAKVEYNNNVESKRDWTEVPNEGSRQSFNFQSPLQAQLSAAYLFGRKGLISMEYNFINYTGMRFSETNGEREPFKPENLGIEIDGELIGGMKQVLRNGHVIKVGAEYKPIETLALRAGYAMLTGATNSNYTDGKSMRLNTVNTNTEYFEQNGTNYLSFGIGYRQPSWYVDLSYALKMQNEDFYPYQFNRTDLEAAAIKTNTSNIALTVGFKM